jgi:5'-nucleotidase
MFCALLTASAQQTKQLVILHTSDTHSRIEPIDLHAADPYAGAGGVVRRATFLKDFRTKNPDVLLFDCGDISQGTPYYNLFRGEVEVQMMNLMGYDAMTIGNHEFDFGLYNMARLFRMAHFPVVCANYDVTGTVLEGLVKPYVVLERGGMKIGVFGVSPKMEGLVQADKCEGIVYNDPIVAAQEVTDLLRTKEGCDVVICLSHLGFRLKNEVCDEKLAAATRPAMRPVSVWSPVAMTRPLPCPATTVVPAQAMLLRSASSVLACRVSACLRTGCDSPVSIESSVCSSCC